MTSHLTTLLAAALIVPALSGCPTRTADTDPDNPDGSADSSSTTPEPTDLGGGCIGDADCDTGFCVEGVCCNSRSCGGCESCAVTFWRGFCTPLPALAEDPKSSCVGPRACDGAGKCGASNAVTCATATDCISGFCVDGVCCETACEEQCYSCIAAGAPAGSCRPVLAGPDINAAISCEGNNTCAPGTTPDESLCLLTDGQSCALDSECASRHCNTFYLDMDRDKFGDSTQPITVCGAIAPAGYASAGGDCCDGDPAAHPTATGFFTHADACGSFDFNCDGAVQKQTTNATASCSGYPPGTPADCGRACNLVVKMSTSVLYTQACR